MAARPKGLLMSGLGVWVDDPELVALTGEALQPGLIGDNLCQYLTGRLFDFREAVVNRQRSLQLVPSLPIRVRVAEARFCYDEVGSRLMIRLGQRTHYAPLGTYELALGPATRVRLWRNQAVVVALRDVGRYLVLEFALPSSRRVYAA